MFLCLFSKRINAMKWTSFYSHLKMDKKRNAGDPLQEDEVNEIVDSFVEALKIPSVGSGYLKEDEHFLNAVTKWTGMDAAKKEYVSFSRTYSILKSSLDSGSPVIASTESGTNANEFSVVAKSATKRAALTNSTGGEFLQIWDEVGLNKTFNLTERALHLGVYTGGFGTSMVWSPDETQIAYLAEKIVPAATPFYSSAGIPTKKEKPVAVGEEYVYKQTWGEGLPGRYYSVVVVLNLNTDEFKVLEIPEEHFPTDLQWIGNSHICGTSYILPVWRLGLNSNRESCVFIVQANGENFRLVTERNKAARSPRVAPSGGFVAWQERILDGVHERARSIHGIELRNGVPIGAPTEIYSSAPANGLPVFTDFPAECWTFDGNTLFAVTPNETKFVILAIPLGNPSTVRKIEGVNALLAIGREYLLVSDSSIDEGPYLKLISVADDFAAIRITEPVPFLDFPVETRLIPGEMSPQSVYVGPEVSSVPEKSVPLFVFPHGGPHSTALNAFSPEMLFYLKQGFGVLQCNFVGSIGGSRDTADELLGRVGDRDVKDCQGIVDTALERVSSLNPEKVVVFGGSHGGFLSAHLSSQYPERYKAAVIGNALLDLTTFIGTTDLTDWAYVETGISTGVPEPPLRTLIPTARNLEEAGKYLAASPIQNVDKVECPSLIFAGSLDLRVPANQGIEYYRALVAHNKIAELRIYPDGHAMSTAPVRFDYNIQIALFFKRYLS